MKSGTWEVWCWPGGVYLWARWYGLSATGTYELCPGAPSMFINQGWYSAATAGQGSGGDVVLDTTYHVDVAPSISAKIDLLIEDPDYAAEGSAKLWLTPLLDITCPGGGFGPRFSASGVALTWPSP